MPGQTGRVCCSSRISLGHSTARDGRVRDGEGERAERERMGNKFVFSFRFQLAIVRIYQSQVLLLRRTPSAVDTEYRLSGIVAKLIFFFFLKKKGKPSHLALSSFHSYSLLPSYDDGQS